MPIFARAQIDFRYGLGQKGRSGLVEAGRGWAISQVARERHRPREALTEEARETAAEHARRVTFRQVATQEPQPCRGQQAHRFQHLHPPGYCLVSVRM